MTLLCKLVFLVAKKVIYICFQQTISFKITKHRGAKMHLDFICNNAELQKMQNYSALERVKVLMQTEKWDLI